MSAFQVVDANTAALPGWRDEPFRPDSSRCWPFWHAGFFFWRAETWLGWLEAEAYRRWRSQQHCPVCVGAVAGCRECHGLSAPPEAVGPFPIEPAPAEYPSDVLASVQVERARGPRRFWAPLFQYPVEKWLAITGAARSISYFCDRLAGRSWDWQHSPGLWTDLCRSVERWVAIASVLLVFLALPAAAQRFERPAWAAHGQACAEGHRHRDTRAEVLASQCSLVTWSPDGCRVRAAVCVDAYTGAEMATDNAAQALQVDHLLPASVAWKRGAWWHREEETGRCATPAGCSAYLAFFNDPRNLNVTRARTNRRKSDLMPGAWCPESVAVRPVIARQFRAVAAAYRIPLTASELAGLRAWDRGVCR